MQVTKMLGPWRRGLVVAWLIVSCCFIVPTESSFACHRTSISVKRPFSSPASRVPTSTSTTTTRTRTTTATTRFTSSYGKGADIWPPTNDKDPVKLSDSFPNGVIPAQVISVFQQNKASTTATSGTTAATAGVAATVASATVINGSRDGKGMFPLRWRKLLPQAVDRILWRAATAQEEEAFHMMQPPTMDRTPVVLALGLAFFVRPLDYLCVTLVSGYLCILSVWCKTTRSDGITPSLPALPPQGHVPALVSNPLGYELTYSIPYARWLKLGVALGLVAPLLTVLHAAFVQPNRAVAEICARPAFWLSCQVMTEVISRRTVTPLPLRILIPVLYNAIRMSYVWNWAFYPGNLGQLGRSLAILNLVYWSLNLFVFLLPVAVMRYMRAHFLCVEAEQVTTRVGMEASMGLSSYK